MTPEEFQRRAEELNKRANDLHKGTSKTLDAMQEIAKESERVAAVAADSRKILENLDAEFESVTGLNKADIAFMFLATAIQCTRWFFLTKFEERVYHDKTTENAKEKKKDKKNRNHEHDEYNPSIEQIMANPVPYDIMFGSKELGLGLSGLSHRYKTPGHDPVFGWILGTANIATSTLTMWDFTSYHIETGANAAGNLQDKISNPANTFEVMRYTSDKFFHDGAKGRGIVAASLIKEYIHLKSDIGSIAGIPMPGIGLISTDLSQKLASYGFDMANVLNVSKQAIYAELVNIIIGMIHYLFYDPDKDGSRKIYEVRTRKVITYSNLISSSSNVLWVTINLAMGNTTETNRLDIGGFLVAIYRLFSEADFIRKVKEEFVFGQFKEMIRGKVYVKNFMDA